MRPDGRTNRARNGIAVRQPSLATRRDPAATGTVMTATPGETTFGRGERAGWVDGARGLGIVLVVIGHAIGGLQSARIVSPDSGYGLAFQLIYSFHMPLFFLLSGLFAERFTRGARYDHVGKTMRRLGYPYLFWSLTTIAVIMSAGSAVNAPIVPGLWPFIEIAWWPTSQLWFLYALMVLQLLYIVAARSVGLLGLFALLAALRLVPELVDLPDVINLTLTYGVFFAIGALASKPLFTFAAGHTKKGLLALAAASFAVWAVLTFGALEAGSFHLDLMMVPASLAGTFATLCLAMSLPRPIEPLARYLGTISMPIYLVHVLFVAGTRIVLSRLLGIHDPALLLPMLVASGIIGPMLLWEASRRLGCERLLGFA